MGSPALFLDRDGVINENLTAHVRAWADFRFLPGALHALRSLATLGLPIVIVTNQAVVARQLVSDATLAAIHGQMLARIAQAGGAVTDILYCPHEQGAGCACRKPAPGLLLAAAARHDLDLRRSVMVGDAATDLLAGQRAGCRTILVRTGRGEAAYQAVRRGVAPYPDAVARDLRAAVPLLRAWCHEQSTIASIPAIAHHTPFAHAAAAERAD